MRTRLDQLHEDACDGAASRLGKDAVGMPIIDAFGGRSSRSRSGCRKLTLNNNFRDVARFDRCTPATRGSTRRPPARP